MRCLYESQENTDIELLSCNEAPKKGSYFCSKHQDVKNVQDLYDGNYKKS
jgi:hypothetical protein